MKPKFLQHKQQGEHQDYIEIDAEYESIPDTSEWEEE